MLHIVRGRVNRRNGIQQAELSLPPMLLLARCGFSNLEILFYVGTILEISFQIDAESISKGGLEREYIKNYQKPSLDVLTDMDVGSKQDRR